MLFTERRSSVIIESDFETQFQESHQEELERLYDDNNQERDQIKRRLRDRAKNTFRRVFSVTSRNNSGDVMELKTYPGERPRQTSNNFVQKRRKSVHFGIEGDTKIKVKKRRLSFDVEFESVRKPKVQNRRFSSYNVMKNASEDWQNKNIGNGIYTKNRRSSIAKQSLSPSTDSNLQCAPKIFANESRAPRRRRIKSSGNVNSKANPPTREDLLFDKRVCDQESSKNKEEMENVKASKLLEQPSPKSASNILKTLNAAKMSETIENEKVFAAQSASRTNQQRIPQRQIKVPYRRRVAVSFSNHHSESPVVLSKFESNKEFDSSF